MDTNTKKSYRKRLQGQLTSALIGLARASDGHPPTESTHKAMIEGLFLTLDNADDMDVDGKKDTIERQIEEVHREKAALIPECAACTCPCGRHEDYDMNQLWTANEEIRSLKLQILSQLKEMAVEAHCALEQGRADEEVNQFFYDGLFAVGEEWNAEQLMAVVKKADEMKRRYQNV